LDILFKEEDFMRFGIFIICALLLFAAPATSHALGFEAAIGGWEQEPSGDLSYKEGGLLDLEEDNNYDEESRVMGRLKVDLPLFLPNIYLMATPMEFDGLGEKDVRFLFGEESFSANLPFYSKVIMDHYDVALYYGMPFLKTATAGILNVELGVNARIIDFSAELEQDATGVEESKDLTFPIPMAYMGVQVDPLEWLCFEAEGRGFEYQQNRYYDAIGRVKVKPMGPMFIAGGWRLQKIDVDESGVEVEIRFKGPFAEAGVEF
jgi:outer membrane protein